MIPLDPVYLVFAAPAFLLMMWAQARVKAAYARGMQVPAPLSGAAAAQHLLEQAGVTNVRIEPTHGRLSDHYDPRDKVLRLSREVYGGRTATSVGIAAHEAGHAIQDATRYAPLVVRNLAVPLAQLGPNAFMILLVIAMFARSPLFMWLGILAYGMTFLFQLINLPVEFDASNRAKRLLSEMGIVDEQGAGAVRKVLNAAGWTYVAATLSSLVVILYYVFRFGGLGGSDD